MGGWWQERQRQGTPQLPVVLAAPEREQRARAGQPDSVGTRRASRCARSPCLPSLPSAVVPSRSLGSGHGTCSAEPNSSNLPARSLRAGAVRTVLGDESVPFWCLFSFFSLMTRLQLVYPLGCAEGLHRNEDPHVYVSDAGEQRSWYKYSSAVFLLTFQFYNPFQKIWTKIL